MITHTDTHVELKSDLGRDAYKFQTPTIELAKVTEPNKKE